MLLYHWEKISKRYDYMTCVNEQSDHDVLFISLQSFECTIYLGPGVQN